MSSSIPPPNPFNTSSSNNHSTITTTIHPSSSSKPSTSSSRPTNHHNSSSPAAAAALHTTTQACAACKYQRRRCTPDCTLAPYFPADQQRQFLNAHRLFGVSNILKIIRRLDPVSRDEAMRSIIYQSNARAADPVGGCLRIITDLEHQIRLSLADLAAVNHHLSICRSSAAAPHDASNLFLNSAPPDIIINNNSMMYGGANYDSNFESHQLHQHQQHHQQQQQQDMQQQHYDYFYNFREDAENLPYEDANHYDNNNNNDGDNEEAGDISNIMNGNGNNISHGLEMEMLSLPLPQRMEDEDVKPLVDLFEVKHAFAIVNEDDEGEVSQLHAVDVPPFNSSTVDAKAEEQQMENVQEHDLKGAASLFTLTN